MLVLLEYLLLLLLVNISVGRNRNRSLRIWLIFKAFLLVTQELLKLLLHFASQLIDNLDCEAVLCDLWFVQFI